MSRRSPPAACSFGWTWFPAAAVDGLPREGVLAVVAMHASRLASLLRWLPPPQAARRRAITELLFFASVGDMRRCQRIVRIWNLPVSDPTCCDYDKRTPL